MGTKVSGLGVERDFGKHVSQRAPHAHRTAKFFHIKGAFINASTGVVDAGKPVKLDAGGKIDPSMIEVFLGRYDAKFLSLMFSEYSEHIDFENDYECLLFNSDSAHVRYDADYECLVITIND